MKKLFYIFALLAALLTLTTGSVFAQDVTPITGTVSSIEIQTDVDTGETIVVVTITDDTGTAHTVNLSLETAESLGLVSVDPVTGIVTANEVTEPVTIDPADILPVEEEIDCGDGETDHPVGTKLCEFFGEVIGVDYAAIIEQHDEGFGFGVIAQALWLTKQVDGDTDTFTALLEAKKSGDYSDVVLADGSTPDNWGDVVKSLKKGEKLGSVMSGKADNGSEETTTTEAVNGRSNGNGNGNGNGNSGGDKDNGNNGDNGKGNGNEGGNGKGNGNGKP